MIGGCWPRCGVDTPKDGQKGWAPATAIRSEYLLSLVCGSIGKLPTGEIEPVDVLAAIRRIEGKGKQESARRSLQADRCRLPLCCRDSPRGVGPYARLARRAHRADRHAPWRENGCPQRGHLTERQLWGRFQTIRLLTSTDRNLPCLSGRKRVQVDPARRLRAGSLAAAWERPGRRPRHRS
jgi:hypothetical protein